MEKTKNVVTNCHWYWGSDKLPPNTIYIGRPGPYGNEFSSKSGIYTKEECIALHRVALYLSLIEDPSKLTRLRQELEHRDLACWCKQPKKIVGCHGDNYLHIFQPRLVERDYIRTVVFYVMDDLRFCLNAFSNWVTQDIDQNDFLRTYILLGDVRVDIQNLIQFCKIKEIPSDIACNLLMTIVVDLELALQETDLAFVEYRFHHVSWIIDRFINKREDRSREPMPPDLPLKRITKNKKDK